MAREIEEEFSVSTSEEQERSSEESNAGSNKEGENGEMSSNAQKIMSRKRRKTMNSYNCFQRWYMAKMACEGREGRQLCSKEVVAEISKAWRELGKEEREKFSKEAKSINGRGESTQAGEGKGNQESGLVSINSRCCPQTIIKMVSQWERSCSLHSLIAEMGFEEFAAMKCGNLPKTFLSLLVSHFDPFTCQLVIGGQAVYISGADVSRMLGIPNGPLPVPSDVKAGKELAKKFCDMAEKMGLTKKGGRGKANGKKEDKRAVDRRVNFKVLRDMLCSRGLDNDMAKQAFMLLALGAVLCPTSGHTPSPKLYSAVVDVREVRHYSWGDFVKSWLCDEIRTFGLGKKKRTDKAENRSVGGCLLLLMIFFFEQFQLENFEKRQQHEHPLKFWNICRVRRRVKLEIEYLKFNKNEEIGQRLRMSSKMGTSYFPCTGNRGGDVESKAVEIAEELIERHIRAWRRDLRTKFGNYAVGRRKRKRRSAKNNGFDGCAEKANTGTGCCVNGAELEADSLEDAEEAQQPKKKEEATKFGVRKPEAECSRSVCGTSVGEMKHVAKDGIMETEKLSPGEISCAHRVTLVSKSNYLPHCGEEEGNSDRNNGIEEKVKEDSIASTSIWKPSQFNDQSADVSIMRPGKSSPIRASCNREDVEKEESAPCRPMTRAWRVTQQVKATSKVWMPLSSDRSRVQKRKRRVIKAPPAASNAFNVQTMVPARHLNKSEMKLYTWATQSKSRGRKDMRNNIVVVSITKDLVLYLSDMRSLAPRERVSNVVVHFHALLLNYRQRLMGSVRRHYFSPFFTVSIVAEAGGDSIGKIASRKWEARGNKSFFTEQSLGYSILHCDMVFLPILFKNHWFLCVLNLRDHRLDVLDSQSSSFLLERGTIEDHVVSVMSKVYSSLKGEDISFSDFERNHVTVPQQSTIFDCGVLMMKYMEMWDGMSIAILDPKTHAASFRKEYVLKWIDDQENEVRAESKRLAGIPD